MKVCFARLLCLDCHLSGLCKAPFLASLLGLASDDLQEYVAGLAGLVSSTDKPAVIYSTSKKRASHCVMASPPR
jgi:hypothetical protein